MLLRRLRADQQDDLRALRQLLLRQHDERRDADAARDHQQVPLIARDREGAAERREQIERFARLALQQPRRAAPDILHEDQPFIRRRINTEQRHRAAQERVPLVGIARRADMDKLPRPRLRRHGVRQPHPQHDTAAPSGLILDDRRGKCLHGITYPPAPSRHGKG